MSEGKPSRLRRGATLEHVYTPTDVHFAHIDSAFQSQEYIAQLIRQDPHDVQKIVTPPKPSPDDDKSCVDDGCWLYEQLRRLAQDLTCPLITNLQLECNRETCPEMKAGEWLYLCVAHGNAAGHIQCCAIDYIVHTLDSATALLNSTRVFPSRLSVPQQSFRHFSSLARRLSRIFAHAYYHHRELFSQAEAESSLYARFLALSQQHSLVPPELLVIPSEGFELNSSNERSHRPADDQQDPGSPQSAIEAGEGTYLPNENERNMARRLFEEWTGSKTTEDADEPEVEEEHPNEDPVEGHVAEQEHHAPVEDVHDEPPPQEPASQAPGTEDAHEGVSEPPAPAPPPEPEVAPEPVAGNGETEPVPAAEHVLAAEQVDEGAARPPSPAKEPEEASHEDQAHEDKVHDDSEQPKDTA